MFFFLMTHLYILKTNIRCYFFIDVIKNCWIKTKIISPAQVEELRTKVRHYNRAAPD
jgi:hypothetical protein